jgi:hypothetical protein
MVRNDSLNDYACPPPQAPGVLFGWSLRLLGVPLRHRTVLEDSESADELIFQAVALIVSTAAFALATFLYSTLLVETPWWIALPTSLAAGGILFSINRKTLIGLRANPSTGRGKALVVRAGTILIAATMGVLIGVKNNHQDIERILAANASAAASEQLQGSGFAPQMAAAHSALKQAEADLRRQAELLKALTEAQARKAKADAEITRELSGEFDPDTGKERPKGNGAKATYWGTVRDEASQHASVLNAELRSLGDVEARLRQAKADIQSLQDQAMAVGHGGQQGASKKVRALFELLRTEWTAWFSVGLGVVLALLPEMALLLAMARTPSLEADYEHLNTLERRRKKALAIKAARGMKEEIACRAKPRPSANRTSARHSATYSGVTTFGGQAAAAA